MVCLAKTGGLFFWQNIFPGFLHAVISYHSSQPCSIFSIRWEFDHLLFSPAFPFGTHLTSVLFTKGNILFFSFSFFFSPLLFDEVMCFHLFPV